MNGSKIKDTVMQIQNVTLMDLETFLNLICILLKLLLFYHFIQNCRFDFHITKELLKHYQ